MLTGWPSGWDLTRNKQSGAGESPLHLKERGFEMGLHNELVLAIIGFSVLGMGVMIDWAEWKVKKYIKNRKARR